MSLLEQFYPESKFGGFSDVDGTIQFYTRVNSLLGAETTVLDFGCGRGAYGEDPLSLRRDLRILKGKAGKVIGIDVDPIGCENPFIDEFHRLQGTSWDLPDASVDLCLCDNVLEHLEEPQDFFDEARRVLRPGGDLCLRTPNAWNYIAVISRLLPNRLHAGVLAQVKNRSLDQDVFPVYYRCNTIPALKKMFRTNGFSAVVYGYEAEPSYLSFSKLAYGLGVLHQKVAPHFLRAAIFAFGRLEKANGREKKPQLE